MLNSAPPPYEITQDDNSYNIYFNMFGIPDENINIRVDSASHEFVVFAKRSKKSFSDQFLWIFSLPESADSSHLETFCKKGVFQFRFPRTHALHAAS